ncbi:MAG: hypothetical protein ACE5GW_11985, partial [Planctomycetota bacterium]
MSGADGITVDEPEHRPEGPARHGWFDGILEGPRGDAALIHEIVHKLNMAGYARADLEIDGGRFTILLDDEIVPGDRLSEARRHAFLDHLNELVDAAGGARGLESTLRSTVVYDEEVVETLFAPFEEELRCVSRVRPIQGSDRRRSVALARHPALRSIGRRQAIVIGGLLVVAMGLVIWSSGLGGRILSADPDEIELEAGPFAGLLRLQVESSWGDYRVSILRGERYPVSAEDVRSLQEEVRTAAERAVVNAVADGGKIYVRLEDKRGRILRVAPVELRPLLSRASAAITMSLPGRREARSIVLALAAQGGGGSTGEPAEGGGAGGENADAGGEDPAGGGGGSRAR